MNKIDNYLLHEITLNIDSHGIWNYNGFLKFFYSEQLMLNIWCYAQTLNMRTGLDAGCGCGFYVAALRRMHINMHGYDANPYTTELSSMLQPKGDCLCKVVDLTKEANITLGYDFVMCINVIENLPSHALLPFLQNIVKLSQKSILIGWRNEPSIERHDFVEHFLSKNYFYKNKYGSSIILKDVGGFYELGIYESFN